MRQWQPALPPATARPGAAGPAAHALAGMVQRLGEPDFATGVLQDLAPMLPAASWSVYRTGHRCKPTLFMSASLGVPDTTQDCWWAYLSGPYRSDRTWGHALDDAPAQPLTRLCHVTAREVEGEHRARVYEAHGVAERVSVVDYEGDGSVFAVNFYRHQHQTPFRDSDIHRFEEVAPVLLALAHKHIALLRPQAVEHATGAIGGIHGARQLGRIKGAQPSGSTLAPGRLPELRERLVRLRNDLTDRELDVCARLLLGMTHEGIASDLGLSVPTVKTYRNRAFARMGIHFRNELFARVLGG